MSIFDFRLLSFIGIKKTPKASWSKYYKKTAMKIHLRDENIYDYMKRKMIKHSFQNNIAINYFGKKITYKEFINKIDKCADKFLSIGIKKYDIVTILSASTRSINIILCSK